MSDEAIKYLSRDEQLRFMKAVRVSGSVRELSFYHLMLVYGCRTVELRELEVKHLKLEENSIFIRRAKGGVSQFYPLGDKTKKLIEKWLHIRDKMKHSDSPYLFITDESQQLSRPTPQKSFERYAAKAKITGHSPHSLRHSCAVNLLENNTDLYHIKMWLGHKNISSTLQYLKVSTGKKRTMMLEILENV